MLESATGLIAPANRQKAGRLAIDLLPPGGVKLPVGTDSALAMEAPGSLRPASASQGVAAKAGTGFRCEVLGGDDSGQYKSVQRESGLGRKSEQCADEVSF